MGAVATDASASVSVASNSSSSSSSPSSASRGTISNSFVASLVAGADSTQRRRRLDFHKIKGELAAEEAAKCRRTVLMVQALRWVSGEEGAHNHPN